MLQSRNPSIRGADCAISALFSRRRLPATRRLTRRNGGGMRERSIVAGARHLACAAGAVCLATTHLGAQNPGGAITGIVKDSVGHADPRRRSHALQDRQGRPHRHRRPLRPARGFPQAQPTSAFAGSRTRLLCSRSSFRPTTPPTSRSRSASRRCNLTGDGRAGARRAAPRLGRVRDTTKAGHRTLRDAQRNREAASTAAQRHDANRFPARIVITGRQRPHGTALRSRRARSNCPPQFFVDGIQATGFSIDDMPPGDVEGVELYAGAARASARVQSHARHDDLRHRRDLDAHSRWRRHEALSA